MALVLKDRVKETTTTTGTSSFSLAGAVTGYDSFGQIGTGNTTYYACYLDGGTEWEVGIGTYTAPSTLSRDTILASSAAGAKVSFSAGQKTIWCDYPAGKAVYLDAAGSISEPIVNISGITGAISTVDTITFDTGYTTTLTTGQLGWDGNNTLGIGMSGGNIVQEIGLQSYIYGKATSAITKGQLIKKTGSNGSSGVITFAPTTASMTDSGAIIGIAAENIALNGFGYIISTGNLKGFNTTGSSSGETWADGDTLYYNPSGNGLMTKTKPSAPNMKTEVAIVINAGSGGSGSVAVEIIHGTQLGGTDSNVQITSATGGQLLSYDQTNQYWKNTNLAAGTGITVNSATGGTITVTNAGVTQATAGTGISVSAGTGNVTITNTAPDQTVSLTGGTGISTTGTYPNFTITNTAPDQTVSLTAGTGISTSGTYPNFTITNSAPDQVVSITGAGGASVTGTYPSFTITTPSGTVTSVTGTAPIASSGGATPAISISQAGTATDGYLSSTDWNTFNNKQPAGTYVTSVGATSPVTSTGGTTPTIAMPAANGSTNGYLTSTDWTTFNSKGSGSVTSVSTGTGLTGGPITTTGTISLANTAVTPASYTYASITVDAQGRLTAASNGTAPVTSVSGTAPIASSGGTTPAISIPKATGSVDGYLSSTDWTTFNNKGNGTVTSVTGTSPVASSGGATPAISLSSGYGDTQNPYASKTANYFLAAPNGSAGVPTFRAIVAADIPTLNQNTTGTAANVTGTVAIANGGTGQTTAAAAFNALNPMTTTGDIIYEDSGGVAARLGIGSSGQVLTVSGGKPAWGAAASSNITTNGLWENAATISANYTIGTNNNAVSAGPITISTGVTVTVPTGSTWTVV